MLCSYSFSKTNNGISIFIVKRTEWDTESNRNRRVWKFLSFCFVLSTMIEWTKRLNAAFGASFLWLICLVYFTQVSILHIFFIFMWVFVFLRDLIVSYWFCQIRCWMLLINSWSFFIHKCFMYFSAVIRLFFVAWWIDNHSYAFIDSITLLMQGFRSFVWTSISYQLKDNLKLSPSASQFVISVAFFPWSIKPLYGYG